MATDSKGNQYVDFVYGNMPMQPDTGRGQVLDKALDGHGPFVAGGYNGFPNAPTAVTAGIVMPNLVGMTKAAATTALTTIRLVLGTVTGTSGVVTVQGKTAASRQALGTVVTITIV
jgi:hypothetical protein